MKKQLFNLVLLFTATLSFAQVKDSTKVEKIAYFGLGLQTQSNLNINSKLAASNLALIPETMPEFIFGWGSIGKKYSSSIEFSGVFADNNRGPNRSQLLTTNLRGNISRNIFVTTNTALIGGLNVAGGFTQFNIFNENTIVDFNNLNPSANTGNIQLTQSRLFLGPAVAIHLFRTSKWKIRLNAAYEFGLSPGTWRSDFAQTTNAVNESGSNRFLAGLVLFY